MSRDSIPGDRQAWVGGSRDEEIGSVEAAGLDSSELPTRVCRTPGMEALERVLTQLERRDRRSTATSAPFKSHKREQVERILLARAPAPRPNATPTPTPTPIPRTPLGRSRTPVVSQSIGEPRTMPPVIVRPPRATPARSWVTTSATTARRRSSRHIWWPLVLLGAVLGMSAGAAVVSISTRAPAKLFVGFL